MPAAATDIEAALERLSETTNRIADQRNDLLQEARANLMALEHIRDLGGLT